MKKTVKILIVCLCAVLFLSACSGAKNYKVDKIEAAQGVDTREIDSIFLNSTITVKNNVLVVKSGTETRLVMELKDNNQTGLKNYTYSYTDNGIKLIYNKNITIYLVKK